MKHKEIAFNVVLLIKLLVFALIAMITMACGDNSRGTKMNNSLKNDYNGTEITSKKVTYLSGNDTLIGYIYYKGEENNKRPAVIVVPEWWGNNDYPQKRARMLADLGYVAFTADMYGRGLVVDNPQDAQANAQKIYSNPQLMKQRMMAAYNELSKNKLVDSDRIAAIGYCFGGSVVLNSASMGVPLDAVVSFHGGLEGFKASNDISNTKVLVCNGRSDEFVKKEHIQNFKDEMKKVNASYEFKEYDNATHAFTNPEATEKGKKFNMPIEYNEEADKASWQDMLDFFDKNFPPNRRG